MVIIVLTCPYCESKNVVRNGHSPNGKQKYLCKDCQRQTRENPTARGYSEEEKESILKAYEERSSLRGLKRTLGVERNTVSKWIKKADSLPHLSETLLKPDATKTEDIILGLNELWSFIQTKALQACILIALSRKIRQVVAYAIGDQSEATCRDLWNRIPGDYQKEYCYTDFWRAYQAVIPEEQHSAVGK
jgi:transposase-like protein